MTNTPPIDDVKLAVQRARGHAIALKENARYDPAAPSGLTNADAEKYGTLLDELADALEASPHADTLSLPREAGEAMVEAVAKLAAEDCVNDWQFCEDAPDDAYDRAVAEQTPFFRPLAVKILAAYDAALPRPSSADGVTQADREAAAAWVVQGYPSRSEQSARGFAEDIRSGASDKGLLVQAFTRHRLSTLPTPSTERAEIRAEIINTPETADFMAAVPLEAAHQRERFGVDHEAGKTAEDWIFLIGYLLGKGAQAAKAGDTEKAMHHTISSAAACANWHAALAGIDNRMRPGIEEQTP